MDYLPNLSASFGPRRRTPRRAAVGLCVVCMFALLRLLHEESPTLASGPVVLRLRLGLSGSTCVWARRSFADLLPEEEDWVEYLMRLLESCTSCLLLVLGLACRGMVKFECSLLFRALHLQRCRFESHPGASEGSDRRGLLSLALPLQAMPSWQWRPQRSHDLLQGQSHFLDDE